MAFSFSSVLTAAVLLSLKLMTTKATEDFISNPNSELFKNATAFLTDMSRTPSRSEYKELKTAPPPAWTNNSTSVRYVVRLDHTIGLYFSGTIVNKHFVLTSATALSKRTNESLFPPPAREPEDVANLAVKAECSDDTATTTMGSTYDVVKIIFHPKYTDKDTIWLEWNVGLAKIEGEFPFSQSIQPVRLSFLSDVPTGKIGKAFGYGSRSDQQVNEEGPLFGSYALAFNCLKVKRKPKNCVCVRFPTLKGSCLGESGGPLIAWEAQWVVMGKVFDVDPTIEDANCTEYGAYTIGVSVSRVKDFILEHVPDVRHTFDYYKMASAVTIAPSHPLSLVILACAHIVFVLP